MILQWQNRSETPKPKGGTNGFLGEVGFVKERIDPEGLVFAEGEYWRAKAKEKLEPGEEVEGVDGLVLKLKRAINREF